MELEIGQKGGSVTVEAEAKEEPIGAESKREAASEPEAKGEPLADEKEPDNKTEKSDWRRPDIVGVIIGILGIIVGLIASYYFYQASLPNVRVNYVAQNDLVARLDRPEFGLTLSGSQLESRSMYRTVVALWNAGNAPIDRAAVRRALTIEFSPKDKLIGAFVRKASHNVAGFELKKTVDNQARIDWTYFDPKFYALIDLFHENDEPPQVSLRYVGDSEIVGEVPRQLDTASRVVIIILSFVLLFLVGLIVAVILSRVVSALLSLFTPLLAQRWPKVAKQWPSITGGVSFLVIFLAFFLIGGLRVGAQGPLLYRAMVGTEIPTELADLFVIDKYSRETPWYRFE